MRTSVRLALLPRILSTIYPCQSARLHEQRERGVTMMMSRLLLLFVPFLYAAMISVDSSSARAVGDDDIMRFPFKG